MLATGAYLKTLREKNGLTQEALAQLVDVTANTIYRIEAGKQEPKTFQIIRLLAVLQGHAKDLAKLINDSDAVAADGEQMALARHAELATGMSDRQLQDTIDLLEQLRDEPDHLGRWLGYGQSLSETLHRDKS